MKGTMDKSYHQGRLKRLDFKYRLKRRAYEVLEAIKKYHNKPIEKILDLGTADGLMLSKIKDIYPRSECIGVEYSQELINTNEDKRLKIIKADVQQLPFNNDQFDIVIAAAIIEHLEYPEQLVSEAYRVLKKGGTLILTTPNPLYEKIAGKIGGLSGEHHQMTFTLKNLKDLFDNKNFKVLLLKKFMISPIGFPFEILIEKALNKTRLNFTLLNQLIVGIKE